MVVPRMAIPGVGYQAYCKDTEGMLIGIHQRDSSAKAGQPTKSLGGLRAHAKVFYGFRHLWMSLTLSTSPLETGDRGASGGTLARRTT